MEPTFEENVRTKGRMMAELLRDRTPVVEACSKVQMSERIKQGKLKTETIDKACNRIDGAHCSTCAFPDKKWKHGVCNFATHLYHENKGVRGAKQFFITPITMEPDAFIKEQQKLNPIKQSKRG